MRGAITMFWVAVDCPRCGARAPLNGIASAARCRCGWELATPTSFWRRIVEPAVQRADQLPEGVGVPVRIGGGDRREGAFTVVVIYGRTSARCALCNRPHRIDRLAALTPDHALGCGHCGALSAVRRAPSWLGLPHADETLLVGEALDGFLNDPLPWYLVRLQRTTTDLPPPLPRDIDTDTEVVAPPEVQGVLSLVLTHAPYEVGVSDHIRLESTAELDINELEEIDEALESADTGQVRVGR